MASNGNDIEKRLWEAADKLWANTGLMPSEYAAPVLGLIFLRYAETRFAEATAHLGKNASGRRKIGKTDYQAQGVIYLPEQSRFSALLQLTEGDNIGKAINEAMRGIEEDNEDLKGVLP